MKGMRSQADATGGMWSLLLERVLRSMWSAPAAWLLGLWLVGWALFGWQAMHPASWETTWDAIYRALAPGQEGRTGGARQADHWAPVWLDGVGRWGIVALFVSTAALALYVSYALWVWHRYTRNWAWIGRAERLKGGYMLEVLIPAGSKADARASADMFGQLWNLLASLSRPSTGQGPGGKVTAERCALSFEMWSTAHTDGKVGFYIWCPRPGEFNRLVEEVRHLVMVHYPRSRVRCVDDPFEQTLLQLRSAAVSGRSGFPGSDFAPPPARAGDSQASATSRASGAAGAAGVAVVWYDLALTADSRYPIGSGASDESMSGAASSRAGTGAGTRSNLGNLGSARPGSPGAGSDPLAAVIDLLGSVQAHGNGLNGSAGAGVDGGVALIGVQVVVAALPRVSGQTQQAANRELTRLRELRAQLGNNALGPQHEERILALEEKADRQGFDTLVRLVAAVPISTRGAAPIAMAAGSSASSALHRAEARLDSLLRAYGRYDRLIAGTRQGFRVARKTHVLLSVPAEPGAPVRSGSAGAPMTYPSSPSASSPAQAQSRAWMRPVAPILGRWPREGVCLPRMLPFMRIGRPCVLNSAELSAIYHFPYQGLEGLAALRSDTYRQIPPPAFARVTAHQEARGDRVTLGVADEDLPPFRADAHG